MPSKRGRAREVAEFTRRVRKAVDEGADAAEEIHKRAANLPLEVLDRIEGLEKAVRDVRRLQDRAIHAVYELVRDVNHQVTRLADEILASPRRGRAARPRKAPLRAAKKPAAA
jgi:phage-related minor tail protein